MFEKAFIYLKTFTETNVKLSKDIFKYAKSILSF